MNSVQIKIEYFGHYIQSTGRTLETLEVRSDIEQAYRDVQSHLQNAYSIVPPFILLLGNQQIQGAIKKRGDSPLKNGEVFTLIPFMSGG